MAKQIEWEKVAELADKIREQGLSLAEGAKQFGMPVWRCPFGKPAMTEVAPVCYSCDHLTQSRRMVNDSADSSLPNKGHNAGRSSIKVCRLAREEEEQ